MNKRRYLIILGSILALFSLSGCGKTTTPAANTTPPANTATETNTNTEVSNTNTEITNTSTAEITVTGQVFIKSYNTPSESYGVLLPNGQEIGMGAYDAMKEELRPYVGDTITVTFSKTCRPSQTDCCRTVFESCGFVKSWTPPKK